MRNSDPDRDGRVGTTAGHDRGAAPVAAAVVARNQALDRLRREARRGDKAQAALRELDRRD